MRWNRPSDIVIYDTILRSSEGDVSFDGEEGNLHCAMHDVMSQDEIAVEPRGDGTISVCYTLVLEEKHWQCWRSIKVLFFPSKRRIPLLLNIICIIEWVCKLWIAPFVIAFTFASARGSIYARDEKTNNTSDGQVCILHLSLIWHTNLHKAPPESQVLFANSEYKMWRIDSRKYVQTDHFRTFWKESVANRKARPHICPIVRRTAAICIFTRL